MSSTATSTTVSPSSANFFRWLYTTILHPLFIETFSRFFHFIKPALGYFTVHPRKGKDTTDDCELSSELSDPPSPTRSSFSSDDESEAYYNPRLDPKNFLHGPLSVNPATRLRQMLARPGIVVSCFFWLFLRVLSDKCMLGCSWCLRWYQRTLCIGSRVYLSLPKVNGFLYATQICS